MQQSIRLRAGGQHCRSHVASRPVTCSRRAFSCSAHTAKAAAPSTAAAVVAPARRDVLVGLASLAWLAPQGTAASAAECELTTAPDGLQFCDVTEGAGAAPSKGSLIRCHYTGKLASNGRVFDSSYDRGRPLTFKVGVREVIAGWDEGILGAEGIPPMKEGGKRRLIIPPELAYGERGAGGGIIPPNATLVFDVELLPRRR